MTRPKGWSPFRRYWVGEALSNLGTRTGNIAYPLLALSLTGSPALAGVLGFARSAPWFVLSLPAGAVVDRLDRRRLMIASDLGMLAAVAALAVATAGGWLTYGELLVLALVQGVLAMLFRIAEVGAVRHLVEDEALPTAVAQNTARDSAAFLAGPPLGGLLYAVRQYLPFVVDAVSYLCSALMLVSIRQPFNAARERVAWSVRSHLREIGEGIAWTWRQPFVRLATLLVGGSNLISNAVSLLLVVVARERGASAPVIGLMLSMAAVGSLAGALVAGRLHRHVPAPAIVVGYPWLAAVCAAALAFDLPPLALGAVYGSWIFFGPTWDAVVVGHRIRIVPDVLQGRVESVGSLVALGGAALGPLVAGLLAEHLSGSAAFLCLAAFGLAIATLGTANRSIAVMPA